jgi:hypothetical protein
LLISWLENRTSVEKTLTITALGTLTDGQSHAERYRFYHLERG